jgi:hypothetical protein
LPDINFEFRDGATQGVAVHPQFARRAALIPAIFLQNGQDEAFLKFPNAFRVKNIAAVHLKDKCFQLIFHDASLYRGILLYSTAAYLGGEAGEPLNFWGA